MIKYRHYTRQANVYPKIAVTQSACAGVGFFWGFGTLPDPHGFIVGDKVRLTGFGAGFDGIRTVTSVPLPTTFYVDIACSAPPPLGYVQLYTESTFTELFPLGFKSISWERESGEIFFRRKMDDELTFFNKPANSNFNFDYFKSIEDGTLYYLQRCEEQMYYITRSCDNGETYEPFWYGYFGINDGKFDLDRCIYKTKIKVDDEYRCLLENKDKDINILQSSPSIDIDIDYSLTFEFADCGTQLQNGIAENTFNGCIYPALQDDGCVTPGVFPCNAPIFTKATCISAGQGWQIYTGTYLSSGGGTSIFTVGTVWVRQTATTLDVGGNPNSPNGTGWINIGSTTIGGQPATQWARTPYDGAYTTYVWSVNGGCTFTGQLTLPLNSVTTYTTGRLMEDVVNYVSSQSCDDLISMKSDFFEIDPPGDTPGYVPGDNYVTGTTNRINLLAFIQKSDFLNPTATTKAVKGILTFNELMNIFKEVFQAYWFIENGGIRIEHISWFTQTVAFDLTTTTYSRYASGTRGYEYIKSKMPREENWKWTESGNIDFIGLPVTYDSSCVNKDDIKNITIQNVVTDVLFVFNNSSNSSKEGFVLVATELDGSDYNVMSEVGLLSGVSLPNNHLSLANLLYNYFRHDRVLLEGTMNNVFQTFFSAIKTKKQVPVSFPFCCDDELIPEESIIETQLGSGYIEESVSLDIKTNMITMTLVYD